MMLLLFALCFITITASRHCTLTDDAIHARIGNTFAARFRSFGGLTVSKAAFEEHVRKDTGMTALCAACYGNAYICGWDDCKSDCWNTGAECDACLIRYHCTQDVVACTGWSK